MNLQFGKIKLLPDLRAMSGLLALCAVILLSFPISAFAQNNTNPANGPLTAGATVNVPPPVNNAVNLPNNVPNAPNINAPGGTLGDVINNTWLSSSLIPSLFTGFAYLFGLYLGIKAIWQIKEHVTLGPQSMPIWEPMKSLLAGSAFLALPTIIDAVFTSLAIGGVGGGGFFNFGGGTVITPHSESGLGFNNTGANGGGLDALLVRFMSDVWQPMHWLIGGFAYLAAIVLVMIGISRVLKSAQEGPRGPAGIGTIITFITAGALFSLDAMMGAFSSSFFGTPTVATFADLQYADGMTAQELGHVHSVISAVLAFMMVVGWISFVRGWFIFRKVADGDSQASLMAGFTHLIGGALAVNLGPLMNAVQNTLGIAGSGIIFN